MSTLPESQATVAQPGSRRRLIRAGLSISGALAVSVLAVSACSAGSSGSSSNQPATTPSSMSMPMSGSSSMSSASGGGSSSAATMAGMIHIQSYKYTVPTSVSPGAKITIMNMDGEAHTVTADSGSAFDVNVPAGSMATLTAPSTPGSYKFHCTYHSNMSGVLVVK